MKKQGISWPARKLGALAIALGLGASALALAQTPAGGDGKASAVATDLSRYKEEPVPGGALLVAAYGVMWGLLAGYVGRLVLRQSRTERELQAIHDRLDADSRGTARSVAGNEANRQRVPAATETP